MTHPDDFDQLPTHLAEEGDNFLDPPPGKPSGGPTELLMPDGQPQRGMAWVVVVAGPTTHKLYQLDYGVTIIGRASDCHIQFNDKSVSRQHARIYLAGPQQQNKNFIIADLGSGNGTLVNGESIDNHFLEDEDYIQIGRVELVFKQVLMINRR